MIMKKITRRIVIAVVALCATQIALAESWRINNDATKGAHFASINAAMASENVVDGDTLYLDPGCVLSDDQTITKAVTVIGTGWGYSDKPYVPARIENKLIIRSAAKVVGLQISGDVNLYHSNVIIEECNTTHIGVSVKGVENVQIIGCYVTKRLLGHSGDKSPGWQIYNSWIQDQTGNSTPPIYNLSQATVANCFIVNFSGWTDNIKALNIDNSLIKNNIIVSTYHKNLTDLVAGSNNLVYNNCMSVAADVSAYAANNVCTGNKSLGHYMINSGVGGAQMQLCENSPAKGAGEGGIDCGPYAEGSLYPFVTYGLPEHIPYFTEAVIPTHTTDGKVKVTLKIENQNR